MNIAALIERLGKLPRAQRLMLFAGLYVLLAAVYYFVLYSPKSTEHTDLLAEQAELVKQKAQVQDRVKNKDQFQAQLDQLMADLKQALKELPNDREIPGLLKGISTLGKKVGLEVKRFQPLPENYREYVAEVPVQLQVEGSYHEVAMFFDRLSKMNRIVYVQNVEMTNPEERGGKVYLTVDGKAVTFRFLTEDELQRQSAEGKKKKQRGGGGGGGGEE